MAPNPMGRQSMTGRLWALIALLSFLWGSSFFFNGVALADITPLTLVFARVFLGALALLAVAIANGASLRIDGRTFVAFCVMAAFNLVIPFLLIVWGQTQIPSGLASILNATTPVFGVVFAHVMTRDEKMTPARVVGVLAGFAGVVVLIGPAALGFEKAGVLAHLAGVGAAASYALSSVYGRRFAKAGVTPLASAALTTAIAAAMLAPFAFTLERPLDIAGASPAALGAVLALGILCTAGGYLLYFRVLAATVATNLMLVTFLMPVTAILLGWLLLAERLRPSHFAGMALIACGLAAIDGRVLAFVRARRSRQA
jgi:drug/metabolite transporter (DMT)-like permease